MKTTLTLLTLALAGISQAQGTSPKQFLAALERTHKHGIPGTETILRQQSRPGGSAKQTASSYRITGWSRYDLASSAFRDSAIYRYSGKRASAFADERENLNAGNWYFLSKADYSANSRDGGPSNRSEVESKYDGSDQKTEVIFREPTWRSKSTMTYNAAGQELTSTEFDSSNGSWMAVRRFQHTYNGVGKLTTTQIVELPGGAPEGRIIRHYDAAGLEDSMSTSMWTGAGYFEVQRLITRWSGKGEQLSVTEYYLDENMDMQPGSRSEYSYDAASRLATSATSVFNSGSWTYQNKDSFGYTGSKMLYTLKRSAIWDEASASWQYMREWSYNLNAQSQWNNETFSTPGSNGQLEPQTRTKFSYNSAGLISRTETFAYDRAQQTYETTPQERELFHYDLNTPTSVGDQAQNKHILAWPNPVSNAINIDAGGSQIEAVEIISATGQRMISQQSGETRLDVSRLPAGIYFLRVTLRSLAEPAQSRFVKI